MRYEEFKLRESFSQEELIAFSYGNLVEDPPPDFDARLPAPPFLMIDRILTCKNFGKSGLIVGEQDIRFDAWYFQCHMPGDPVQPGCLCVDAVWQLLGFYCVWRGALGAGRALGCNEVHFNGQIRPFSKVVRYEVEVKRYSQFKESEASIAVGNGNVFVDDEPVAVINNARTGVFKGIVYRDYPHRSLHSIGGTMRGKA